MKPLPYARKKEILEMLKRNDFIDINQLSQKFNVSYMTIHRDLKELEDEGMVSRIYGGVVAGGSARPRPEAEDAGEDASPAPMADLTLEERFRVRRTEKAAIAQAAAGFVEDGDIICLDASTSALQMCPLLHDKRITVVTNALNTALQFSDSESVTVIVAGGVLRKSSLSLSIVHNNEELQHLNIDKCFFSATALSYEKGMMERSYEESLSKRALLRRTDKLFVLADHTKLCASAPYVNCAARRIHTLITDRCGRLSAAREQCLLDFQAGGVRVIRSGGK